MRSIHVLLLLPVMTLLAACNMTSPSVWFNEDQNLSVDIPEAKSLTIRTDNGFIEHQAVKGGKPALVVKVQKRTGGRDLQDAQAAMKQLEVFCEPQGADGRLLGYRWKTAKESQWNVKVSFTIDAPATLAIDAETSNGEIRIHGVDSTLRAVSHNGDVNVESAGPWMEVLTHNGAIDANYAGPKISAITHNGEAKVDLRRCREVGGEVRSHNGEVSLRVGKAISAALSADTSNGEIKVNATWQMRESKRNHMHGIIGHGGPTLTLETHNGGIDVKQE